MKMDINKAKKTIAFLRNKRMNWAAESDLNIVVQAAHLLTVLMWQMLFFAAVFAIGPLRDVPIVLGFLVGIMALVAIVSGVIVRKTIKIRDFMLTERIFNLKETEANQVK